jgi:uncharacterized protein YwgA
MTKKIIDHKDLLLSFLYSPGQTDNVNEPILGRTRIMKMMFLFREEMQADFLEDNESANIHEFKAYYYGPYSDEVFEDIKIFQGIGFIEANMTAIPLGNQDEIKIEDEIEDETEDETEDDNDGGMNGNYEKSYTLSANGKRYVRDEVWKNFSDNQRKILKKFKRQINSVSLNTLLDYVYKNYPEKTGKSKIA